MRNVIIFSKSDCVIRKIHSRKRQTVHGNISLTVDSIPIGTHKDSGNQLIKKCSYIFPSFNLFGKKFLFFIFVIRFQVVQLKLRIENNQVTFKIKKIEFG